MPDFDGGQRSWFCSFKFLLWLSMAATGWASTIAIKNPPALDAESIGISRGTRAECDIVIFGRTAPIRLSTNSARRLSRYSLVSSYHYLFIYFPTASLLLCDDPIVNRKVSFLSRQKGFTLNKVYNPHISSSLLLHHFVRKSLIVFAHHFNKQSVLIEFCVLYFLRKIVG